MHQNETILTQFIWYGINRMGQPLQGTIASSNITSATNELRNQGIIVKKLRKKIHLLAWSFNTKIGLLQLASFSRQLATLLMAGIPLIQGLTFIEKSSANNKFIKLVQTIKTTIEHGHPFANALMQHPNYFDHLYCNLIAAGEQSGTLEVMLDRLATYQEKILQLRKKLRKALTYPTAVVLIGSIVATILLVKVIPQFEILFKNAGSNLPPFTQFVLSIAHLWQTTWWLFCLLLIFLVITLRQAVKKLLRVKKVYDALLLKLPLFGKLLQQAIIARFCRTLATTFATGMPLINILQLAANAAGNSVYTAAILDIRAAVINGEQLHSALQNTGQFPPLLIQMVAIGEAAGALDTLLLKAATIYEADVDTVVDNLSSLLEPTIMAILGILIGGLVVAMYLPIFKMGSVF